MYQGRQNYESSEIQLENHDTGTDGQSYITIMTDTMQLQERKPTGVSDAPLHKQFSVKHDFIRQTSKVEPKAAMKSSTKTASITSCAKKQFLRYRWLKICDPEITPKG